MASVRFKRSFYSLIDGLVSSMPSFRPDGAGEPIYIRGHGVSWARISPPCFNSAALRGYVFRNSALTCLHFFLRFDIYTVFHRMRGAPISTSVNPPVFHKPCRNTDARFFFDACLISSSLRIMRFEA